MDILDVFVEFNQEQVNAAFDDITWLGASPEDWMLMHKKGDSLYFKNIITRSYWKVDLSECYSSNDHY